MATDGASSGGPQVLDVENPHGYASFAGQTAVITGGTQGLGLATAQLMKARGASGLVLIGRDEVKGEAAAAQLDGGGCRALFVGADLAEADRVDHVVETTRKEFGSVNVLVAAAAATFRGTVWNTTADMWDEMLDINVRAQGLLISGIGRLMRERGHGGSMVVIGSVAHHGGIPELFPYIVAKHALEAMVKSAAHSLVAERIRVNMLNPGWMDTPAEHVVQKRFHNADDSWLETAEAAQPFGRLLKPQEVARGICFLASAESGMMTGSIVDFDQTIAAQGGATPASLVPQTYPWETT